MHKFINRKVTVFICEFNDVSLQVTISEMSLEEMKKAASEIKLLRPIQEAIVSFFKAETWEELVHEFGSEVLPEKLLRFAIKDFEQSHDFQTYLERLKRRKAGDEIQEADGLLDGKHGAKGMIIFSPDLNRVEQATIAKLPNFRGAFLAVGDAYDDCEIALSMIRLTSKLNFTKTTSFNLVLFVNVDSVRMVKERMMGEGAVDTQTAHFYVKNSHQSRDRTGPYLRESLITFIIGHWSVSRQVTARHLSASNLDNVISLDGRPNEILPEEAFSWLVQNLSYEGDTVIDMDNDTAGIFTAALKEGRSGVWITSQSSDVQQRLRLQTIFAQSPDVASTDSEYELE
ncbi:uncharacterized protein LOC122949960 [Acropora millepora]|uniref:uncharacterized protein LOC122949960 n=1 Tax=Acropora millepora TaxID=45264 RepID=UPI001CF576CF|nr:uncharacterized protein LOC122949960 [Acropora millepora]